MDDPAYLAARPEDAELYEDPDDAPPPDVDDEELAAAAKEMTAEQARVAAVLNAAARMYD
jgi:hypothetical protein